MSRLPVPVRDIAARLPDAGRIRIGLKTKAKNGKERPQKLDKFRFTSPDRQALGQVSAIYGGQVTEWKEPKAAPGQWQVVTEARELNIALPPDPLGNTPIYELWGGGGCERRCDAETCEMLTQGPDGFDLEQAPCICITKGQLECKLKTRLSVMLPNVRFGGVWRLDTGSEKAAHELPGMVDLIRSLQDKGIQRATLRVEWRKQVLAGKTYEFAVPVLGLDATPNELAAGETRLGQIGTGNGAAPAPAVASGEAVGELSPPPPPPPPDPDDEVVDAEVIDDLPPLSDRGIGKADVAQAADTAFADWREAAPSGQMTRTVERLRRAVTWRATGCRTASLSECTPQELHKVHGRLGAIASGRVTVASADPWDDAAGVTFRADGGDPVTVLWAEFETGGQS